MTIRRNLGLAATLLAVALSASACIHVPNPFHGLGGDKGPKHKYLGKGERIPLAAFDDTLHPADALKGQDFYIPPPAPIAVPATRIRLVGRGGVGRVRRIPGRTS